MFVLALIYNVIHAAGLFYHVITLNVAVNSYSNALLTLLLSTQFVEIKSTVFKKFEKDNIFQLTCADVVERFQLWLMLTIIALRNIVEVGGLSILSSDSGSSEFEAPIRSNSILPNSFTILPSWAGEVLSPFLLVIGIEMLVDWIKHAYISKFNCVKPAVYQRYLDVLAKDYYTNVSCPPPLRISTDKIGIRQPKPHQTPRPPCHTSLMPLHPLFSPDLPHVPRHPSPTTHPIHRHRPLRRASRHLTSNHCRPRTLRQSNPHSIGPERLWDPRSFRLNALVSPKRRPVHFHSHYARVFPRRLLRSASMQAGPWHVAAEVCEG